MAKNTDDRAMIELDQKEEASIVIPDDAFETIICIAAVGTDGVYCVGSGITKEKINSLGNSGVSGVKVDVADKTVNVYLVIQIEFGYNIPDVMASLTERIKTNVESMTDFTVNSVNVKVSDIYMGNK